MKVWAEQKDWLFPRMRESLLPECLWTGILVFSCFLTEDTGSSWASQLLENFRLHPQSFSFSGHQTWTGTKSLALLGLQLAYPPCRFLGPAHLYNHMSYFLIIKHIYICVCVCVCVCSCYCVCFYGEPWLTQHKMENKRGTKENKGRESEGQVWSGWGPWEPTCFKTAGRGRVTA